MVTVVGEAFGPIEANIVAHVLEGRGHELIGERPASELVVDVPAGVGEVDAEWFLFGFANEGGVDVSAADVGKASDGGEHFAEGIGPFPGNGERANASRAGSADGVHVGVFREGVGFFDFGNDFFEEETCETVAEAVVFGASIGATFGV